MKKVVLSVLFAMMVGGQASWVEAQGARGSVTGRVVDPFAGVLQGAQVELRPAGTTTATDEHGEFTIRDIPAGDYTLVTTYVGFQTTEMPVTIDAGSVKRLDVTMQIASQTEDVLVTAERPRGEAEAINRTRAADNILQVLPSEVITSLPNANVADALGRLPSVTLGRDEGEGVYAQVRGAEPRLTNVTINGITVPSPEPALRQVRLDALPADLIDSVEINKTLAANQDGDGIGGSVNFRTKTASESRTLMMTALQGHNNILGGRNNNQYGITAGGRFGARKTVGILGGFSYDYNGRGIDDIEPAISPNSTFATPLYDNNTVREYRYYRKRYGGSGSADWKINDFGDLYITGLMSNLQDYGDKWYYGPQASGSPKFYTSSKRPEYSIGSINGGGRHSMQASWFNWEGAVARASELDSAGNPKADFSWIGPKLTCGFDPAAQTNVYTPVFGAGCDGQNSPLQNAANWGFKDLTTSTGSATQMNVSGSAAFGHWYHSGSRTGSFEAGAKLRNARKSQNASETVYDGWNAASYPMTSLLDSFSSTNYYGDKYYNGHYGPVSNFNSVVSFVNSNLASFVDGYKTAANTFPNDFNLTERIGAAYAMNTYDWAHVRLQTGVRIETTNVSTHGNHVNLFAPGSARCATATGCGVPVPVSGLSDYTNVLPSVSLKYAFSDSSDLRAVYGRGVSRPDAYQLVPYVTEDDSTNPPTTAVGNPKLTPETANNYDLLFERFLNPVGLMQAGFFYKQLNNPLVTLVSTPVNPADDYYGQQVTQWQNAGGARLYGFEVSYQQHMTYLPGLLGGFGVLANYSWTGSRVTDLPGRSDAPALQRQAPNTWNLSPTYDRGRTSVRLGLTFNGPSIYQYGYTTANDPSGLGPHGPSGDQYTYPHLQVDLQGTYEIARGLRIVAYGLNINNEVYGLYIGSKQFVRQREYYMPTFAVGLKYSLDRK